LTLEFLPHFLGLASLSGVTKMKVLVPVAFCDGNPDDVHFHGPSWQSGVRKDAQRYDVIIDAPDGVSHLEIEYHKDSASVLVDLQLLAVLFVRLHKVVAAAEGARCYSSPVLRLDTPRLVSCYLDHLPHTNCFQNCVRLRKLVIVVKCSIVRDQKNVCINLNRLKELVLHAPEVSFAPTLTCPNLTRLDLCLRKWTNDDCVVKLPNLFSFVLRSRAPPPSFDKLSIPQLVLLKKWDLFVCSQSIKLATHFQNAAGSVVDWLEWLSLMPALVSGKFHIDTRQEALRRESFEDALHQRRHRQVIQASHAMLRNVDFNIKHRYTWGPSLRLDLPALKTFTCSCLLSREKNGSFVTLGNVEKLVLRERPPGRYFEQHADWILRKMQKLQIVFLDPVEMDLSSCRRLQRLALVLKARRPDLCVHVAGYPLDCERYFGSDSGSEIDEVERIDRVLNPENAKYDWQEAYLQQRMPF